MTVEPRFCESCGGPVLHHASNVASIAGVSCTRCQRSWITIDPSQIDRIVTEPPVFTPPLLFGAQP